MSDERLNDLEMKIAHQDAQLQELSDVVQKQYDKIDALEAKVGRLLSKIDESGGSGQDTPVDKPPHY